MAMTSTTNELLLSVHGIEMKFTTNSPELANSVETLSVPFNATPLVLDPC